jgi:hypothetical protein
MAGTGQCVSWAQYTVKEMSRPAGWREVTKSRQIDGLKISTQLKKEAASFTVNTGEGIVGDGFDIVPSGADFNHQACVMSSEGPQCDLQALQLLRITANVSAVHEWAPERASILPQASRLLQAAVYRPSTVRAKKGPFDGNYGQRYSIDEK